MGHRKNLPHRTLKTLPRFRAFDHLGLSLHGSEYSVIESPLANGYGGQREMTQDEQNLIADLYESTSRNLQETNALNARLSAVIAALTEDDPDFEKKLNRSLRPLADRMLQRASGIQEQTRKIVERLRGGDV
jgi:predicted trehalose synthase